ncbi:hypothetical protein EZJ43_01565 [Pedobacter changchengzhani]|uniref:Tetratricopeptide repeat protein n=1 Tax=Pedobacter changchengzhani TaxID=2529274 RepID=A0A4R5MQ84_9SPHI|nr:hypothetical protein [Pedobacter changchengzhani]TDG37806.1 hypothetical protein EZJ43_01565 [Pedobacter changchengzhani]
MKRINLKKSLIFSVSFFIAFLGEIAVNIACGPEQDPYDYYVSYFHNNTQGDEYSPFAFNEMVYLYHDEEVKSEPQINSAEWAKYLNVKTKDVFKVMYGLDKKTSLKLTNFKTLSTVPENLKMNSFLISLTKNPNALKYYNFAKKCEPLTARSADSWDPIERDSTLMIKRAKESINLASSENDEFLKLRYQYQAERLYHYAGNFEESKIVYEKWIAKSTLESAVKGWALAVYAGAVRYAGNPERSAYLFSKVFESNPERRIQAYKNYFYTSANINAVLKYAKNDLEKANIWAISGFGNPAPNIQSLQKVYEFAPSSLLNGALLVREINKLEQNLIKEDPIYANPNSYFNRYDDQTTNKDSVENANLMHLKNIKEFAVKLATEQKYPQWELGTISAAYLSWMENKPEEGLKYLSQLKEIDKLPAKLKDQSRIVQLLISAGNIKQGSNFNASDLVTALKWLDEKRYAENKAQPKNDYYDTGWASGENRFTTTTRNFYQQILAPAYLKIGDTAKAAAAMLKGDLKYRTITNHSFSKNMDVKTTFFWQNRLSANTMLGLVALKSNPKNDGLDGLIADGLNKLSSDDFNELMGTTYLRTHDYAKALTSFNKIAPNYKYFTPSNWYSAKENQKTFANPFIERIKDYPKKYGKTAPGSTKKTFAQEMLRLERLTLSDKANAPIYYYKMANAVYQSGYYGNFWFLISYEWSSYASFEKPTFSYDGDYKLALKATEWYKKARSLTKDPNLKAKCTFMLAKCEQKKIINDNYGKINWYNGDYQNESNKFLALNYKNSYFKEMKANYSKTPFYKIAVNECSYFSDFLRGK